MRLLVPAHRRGREILDDPGADPALEADARSNLGNAEAGDALALPFTDHSVDIVTCSQVLHHFADAEAILILRKLHRDEPVDDGASAALFIARERLYGRAARAKASFVPYLD